CKSIENKAIAFYPTRYTPELKAHLRARDYSEISGYTGQSYDPLDVEPTPSQPLPEFVRGNRWQFSALTREDLEGFLERTIPFVGGLDVSRVKELSAETLIPGMTMFGGKRSLALARWCDRANPYALRYVSGDPDGMVLDAGLSDRWVLATFTDEDVAIAARKYETRRQASHGWHFLLVLPDDSGATVTGIWLLRAESQ
ncbi:MAG: Tab2 family RNA-binding protein, partial [Cyanobacteria bacterium J06648_11]